MPKVSVIIATYNYGQYIASTLQSLILQEDENITIEILVIDDGSTDNTKDIVKSYAPKVQYFYQKNQGVSAARNKGLEYATGDFILFLDADDLLPHGVLSSQIANLEAHKEYNISVCQVIRFRESKDQNLSIFAKPLFKDSYPIHFCYANIAPLHTFLLRKSAAQSCRFEVGRNIVEDYLYFFQCMSNNNYIIGNPNTAVLYREHEGSAIFNSIRNELPDEKICRLIKNIIIEKADFFKNTFNESTIANIASFLKNAKETKNEKIRLSLLEEAFTYLKYFKHHNPCIENNDLFKYYIVVALWQSKCFNDKYDHLINMITSNLYDYDDTYKNYSKDDLHHIMFDYLKILSFDENTTLDVIKKTKRWLELFYI